MYEPKNFERLLGIDGFSDIILRNHFTLYEGYVSNVNKLLEFFKTAEKGTPVWNELRRRFGWEWNGMRLHEFYFGSLVKNGNPIDPKSALAKKINEDFGSFEAFEKDFKATGAMRGIGWAILVYDTGAKKLLNVWSNEHDAGHLAGTTILLPLDVFEHAFALDYGLKRADYINAFWNAIDWNIVSTRFGGK